MAAVLFLPLALAVPASAKPTLVVQEDGRIVTILGTTIHRLGSDGTVDASFAEDGALQWADLAAVGSPQAVALQPDGKLLVTGQGRLPGTTTTTTVLLRLDQNGELDPSFGNGGRVATSDVGIPSDVVPMPDGRVVVAGTRGGYQWGNGVVRFNANGSRDTSFELDPIAVNWGCPEIARALAAQPDGKLVLAGPGCDDFAAARLNPDGSLDPTFSDNGWTVTDFWGQNGDYATDVVVQPDGRIVVAGWSVRPFGLGDDVDFGVVRYKPDGTLDESFSGDGRIMADPGAWNTGEWERGRAVALDEDGSILVAGDAEDESIFDNDFAFKRYAGNGALLGSWRTDTRGGVSGLAIQEDRKILATGPVGAGVSGAVRYLPNGSLDTGFGVDGFSTPGAKRCPDGTITRAGDTNCDGAVRVAVLGDSYISGEGAADAQHPYRQGTDAPPHDGPKNKCHRTERSWAVQIARRLAPGARVVDFPTSGETSGDLVAFLACSGAVTDNIDGVRTSASADNPAQPPTQYDESTQLDRLEELGAESFDVIFLSIGGNDARFGHLIETCLLNRCTSMKEWASEMVSRLEDVRDRIVKVAVDIREAAPGAELYQANYPNPLDPQPGDCWSFGLSGADIAAVAHALGLTPVALAARMAGYGDVQIDAIERRWLAETFLPALNERVRESVAVSGAHLVDLSGGLENHPICDGEGDPYAHGIIGGSDKLVFGNESFHPNVPGQEHLDDVVLDELPLDGFGSRANVLPGPVGLFDDPNTLRIYVTGNDPDTDVFVAGGSGYVTIYDAESNTVTAVSTFSLGRIGGKASTDENGNATIPIRIPADAAPGLHHAEIWTASGERLGAAPFWVKATPGCTEGDDADGDLLADSCDHDPADGPAADADGDSVPNHLDNCPLAANPGLADADADGEGDACDPDQGADLFATALRGPFDPPAAGPPTAPTQPAAVAGERAATVTWEAPEEDGGAPITGYQVRALPAGETQTVGGTSRQAVVGDLDPGASIRFAIRAVNQAGAGATAITDAVTPLAPVPGPPVVGPPSGPLPSGDPGGGLAGQSPSEAGRDGRRGARPRILTLRRLGSRCPRSSRRGRIRMVLELDAAARLEVRVGRTGRGAHGGPCRVGKRLPQARMAPVRGVKIRRSQTAPGGLRPRIDLRLPLQPGLYRVAIRARNEAGSSPPAHHYFRVLGGSRRR